MSSRPRAGARPRKRRSTALVALLRAQIATMDALGGAAIATRAAALLRAEIATRAAALLRAQIATIAVLGCAAIASMAVLGCAAPAAPAASSATSRIEAIDSLGEAAVRDGGVVGLSIVVMRGDRIVHARGYGLADVEHGIAATERSVFPLASLSKQFWAVGIAQLVEANRLSVESAVADVLYHFPDRRVRVKHLLTQTSGLGDDAPDEDDVYFKDLPPLAFEPGTWWLYSNRGAILARRIVEQIASTPWRQYLHDHLAKDLPSVDTCDEGNHVTLYDGERHVWTMPPDLLKLSLLCANAIDVARFERSLDTGTLLRPETVARMRMRAQIGELALPYGWFTRIAHLSGHRAFGHTGNLPASYSAAFRFPDDDLTIVVLENAKARPAWRAYELVEKIARLELHLPSPLVHEVKLEREQLDEIAGNYVSGSARVTVSVSDREHRPTVTVTNDGKPVWQGELIPVGPREMLGGPEGPNADAPATFWPPHGKASAILVGHDLLLDQVFRRE